MLILPTNFDGRDSPRMAMRSLTIRLDGMVRQRLLYLNDGRKIPKYLPFAMAMSRHPADFDHVPPTHPLATGRGSCTVIPVKV